MSFVKGDLVWFDTGNGREPGRIVDSSTAGAKKSVTVVQTNVPLGSKPRMIRLDDLSRVEKRKDSDSVSRRNGGDNPDKGRGIRSDGKEMNVNDMIQMSELNEDTILTNLKVRFSRNTIYTSIGSILVAVNPYRMFPELYNLEAVKNYENYLGLSELSPHLFAIGSAALYQMNQEQEDQVVIISGESGSGKTESTKLIMQYLAAVHQSTSNLVSEQILEANPLLESFGNAKTIRNDNSSRFGKYLAIYFSKEGKITGAKITEYLLEKSRICTHGEDERNYHVFYELLAGLSKDEKNVYGLQEEHNYYYLNQGGDRKLPGKNDASDFRALKSAMQVLNFTAAECETVFKILAAVLHIGNIRFKARPVAYQAEGVIVEREDEVRWVAHLLQIPDSGLVAALTSKTTEARNEKLLTPLNSDQAFDARDAIAKALYSRLFTWLVDRTNQIVAQNQLKHTSIALLDIFGFEDFKENSFEQLCINYANETLQFYFNQHVFKLEQQEYAKEKITWSQIEFVDNQSVLDLIAKKPVGILHILDDESSFPKATDQSFLEKCHYNHGTNSLYQRPKTQQASFAIRHYAGQVSYNVNRFLDKNRDTLRADVIELFIGSGVVILSKMFQEWKDSSDFTKTVKRGAGRFVTMKPRTPTVSARFQESLNLLVETMSKCRPHFVRCVKPNSAKAPAQFENKLVLDQLKYTGMLETIRIRKIGYPVRLKFSHFLSRYRCLLRKRKIASGTSSKDSCQAVLDAFNQLRNSQPSSSFKNKLLPEYQLGTSKVFLRESFHNKLELERDKVLGEAATVIQRVIRGYIQRKKYYAQRSAAIKIQTRYRGYRQRKKYATMKKGITRAQANIRMHQERRRYAEEIEKTRGNAGREASRRQKEAKTNQEQRAKNAAHDVKNPQIPAELSYILNKLDDWHAPHTDRNIVKVSGKLEELKDKNRYELPRDLDAYQFQKYAGIYCKDRTWGPRQDPIDQPFLTNLHGDEKKDALEIFRLILWFTQDINLGEKKEKVLCDYIVHKGLMNERLRDEIYCQFCNQTWPPELLNNSTISTASSVTPSFNMTTVERTWLCMSICLSAFPPSQTMYKYLLKYITDFAIDSFKFTCQSKLLQCHAIEPAQSRVYPPSLLETKSSRKNGAMAMNVTFQDGDQRTGPVTSWTTGADFARQLLRQRGVYAESNGWTAMLIHDDGNELVELNGSDYLLDIISEMELPSSFPVLTPAFLHFRGKEKRRHSNDSDLVGKLDFDEEDENDDSGNAKRKPTGQKITRLGLAKESKLNERYEVDKHALAKTSALNKRYLLTEADVAIGLSNQDENKKEHPGLSQSQLNERYRSGQSLFSEPDTVIPHSRPDAGHRAPSAASDAQSMASHVRNVVVPTSSNPKEISDYLDEIFDPVLRSGLYGDDDEMHVRLDAKTLATSIKGGGSKQPKAKNESAFRSADSTLPAPHMPYPYVAPLAPVLPMPAQYGLPLGSHPMTGMPAMGYYPSMAESPHYPPLYYVPSLSHARSSESLLSDRLHGPQKPSQMLGFPRPTSYHPGMAPSYARSLSSETPDLSHFGQGLAGGPIVDPVYQQYLQQQQQNLAAQVQLQHHLANALHQNYELQQKLLQNQHEMVSAQRHRASGGSDGNTSGSPDSLPPTPTGTEDAYLFDKHNRRGGTPLPTPSEKYVPSEPPLPPRQYEVPPRTKPAVDKAPPPPPPPPPPPLPKTDAPPLPAKSRVQIPGRALTIKVGKVRWPPREASPEPVIDHFDPPKKTALLPGSGPPEPPPAPPVIVKTPEPGGRVTPNKLRKDTEAWNRLESAIGGRSEVAQPKPKLVTKRSNPVIPEDPHTFVRQPIKPVLDAKGVPLPPPPPAMTNTGYVPPPPPARSPGMKLPSEVFEPPKLKLQNSGGKVTILESPVGRASYAYNRTHWSMTLRKEFFTPAEKIESPLATDLIFSQICNDVFHEFCVRMTREEQQNLRTLFATYGITDFEAGSQPEKLKATVKKIIIDAARALPLYFCRLYPIAEDKDNGSEFRRQFIGMSHSGLRMVKLSKDQEGQEHLTVSEYRRFDEILEISIVRPLTVEITFFQTNTNQSAGKTRWTFHTHKALQIKALIDQMSSEADQIAGAGVGEYVRAVADYRTKDPTLLSFRNGDIIKLAMRNQSYLDKGWLYGNIGERWGIFPWEYVVALNRQEAYLVKANSPHFAQTPNAKMTNGTPALSFDKENRPRTDSSSSSSQRSSSPERGVPPARGNDGKLSMVEFAMFNFRQSIDKYGVINPSRRDSNRSSIQGSIKQIEKLKDANGKEWTWKEQAEMVKFSRSPIRHSLLKFDSSEADKISVETFIALMRFMGDYPMDTAKNQNDVECVYAVLMVCYQYPLLRDEIYCQIIKQTTNNKSAIPESCQRGWRFFSIVAAYFDCSEVLRPYMFKYLETAAYDKRRPYHGTALVCLQNLRKTFKYGGRINVPSVDEIAAITAGRSSKRQIYVLPGGTEKILNTKSSTVVEDVIIDIGNQLKINSASEMDEYSVYALRDKEDMYGVPLQYEQYVLDVTTDMLKNSTDFLLLFRRSVWYFPLRTSDPNSNSAYIDMIFHQVVPDYLDGLLLVLPKGGLVEEEIREMGKIAALLHRCTDKQQPPDIKEIKYLLPKPTLGLREPTPSQWLQIVHDYHQASQKLSAIEAKAKFLEKLEKWTLFGSNFFFITRMVSPVSDGHAGHSASSGSSAESSGRRYDTSLVPNILAINKKGVFFLDTDSRETVIHHPFSDILSTRRIKSNDDGALYLDMKCGNLLSQRITRIQTHQAHEIARLIGHYIHIENSVLASKAARSNIAMELQQSEHM